MTRTRFLRPLLLVIALTWAGPVWAQESSLARIPESAPVVIHVRGVERPQARLIKLIRNSLPGDAGRDAEEKLTEAIKDNLGDGKLQGLSADGPAFLVFSRLPASEDDAPKTMAILLPVTDYPAFLSGILKKDELKAIKKDSGEIQVVAVSGKDLYLRHRKGYVVIAWDEEPVRTLGMPSPGLDRKLTGEKARRFLESDLSVYVSMPAVVKTYQEFFKDGRAMIEKALWQFSAVHEEDPGTRQSLKRGVDLLFQAAEDGGTALGCVDFRPEGLAVHASLDFRKQTKTAALLKDFIPLSMAELGQLPAHHLAYSAMRIEPAMLQLLPRNLYEVSVDPKHKHHKAVEDALRDMNEARPRLHVTAFQQWGQWTALLPWNDVQVWTYDDPAKAAAARLRLIQLLKAGDSLEGAFLKDDPIVKAAAKQHRGYKLHYAHLTWDFERMLTRQFGPDMPEEFHKQMKVFLSRMIGDGKHIWFGSDGKNFVQITAKDWDKARDKLDQLLDRRNTLAGQKAFQETRKHLPAKVTALLMLDMSAYGEFLGQLLEGLGGRKEARPVSAKKGDAAYLGFAVTAGPDQVQIDAWLPATGITQFYLQMRDMVPAAPDGGVQKKQDNLDGAWEVQDRKSEKDRVKGTPVVTAKVIR